MRRKFYLLEADRTEVKQALELFALARSDAVSAKAELSVHNATGMAFIKGRGLGLTFAKREDAQGIAGIGAVTYIEELPSYTAFPDMRTTAGKKLREQLENIADLRNIWQWSLEKALGIYGVVMCGYPPQFHYCVARALADGRVIVSTPTGKNRPQGGGYSRNFEDPVIPDWAIEITESEYNTLKDLPAYVGDRIIPAC